jgi:hypothetical protein
MWNPNPPYIYFASDTLACARDTRALALAHGLIWRPRSQNLYQLQAGDHLLLVFWKRQVQRFVPLARFKARAAAADRGEQPCQAGDCYCVIPQRIRQQFLNAAPGQNSGHGYTAVENARFTAICIERLRPSDAVDQIWQNVGHGPHDLPGVQYRYGWQYIPRQALLPFSAQRLAPRILPANMHA